MDESMVEFFSVPNFSKKTREHLVEIEKQMEFERIDAK